MGSQCIVPDWNLRHQRQEQLQAEETNNRSSHVPKQLLLQNPTATTTTSSRLIPMSNCGVTELTWENGHLAMHGLGGFLPTSNQTTKPTWETLESIVHQATYHKQNQPDPQTPASTTGPIVPSMHQPADTCFPQMAPTFLAKKLASAESNQGKRNVNSNQDDHQHVDRSACGGATAATFCRDNNDNTSMMKRTSWASFESPRSLIKNKTRDHEDSAKFCPYNDATTTMMTWPSFESPRSLKTRTTDEDSDCHGASGNQDEDHETKTGTVRSQSSRRSRTAAVHNQSERRRRDRINQKMKALQKLVPNASKTDKASMLDEVIQYLKQLQAQVQMMSSVRNMSQMMINPLGMQQQQLQMSLLARMGMGVGLGMGMGMFNMNPMAHSTPQSVAPLIHSSQVAAAAAAAGATSTFVPPQFVVPPTMIPTHASAGQSNQDSASNGSVTLPDPYCAFLAQSMNMELYNKMAAFYRQQVNQSTQATSSLSMQSNHARGDQEAK